MGNMQAIAQGETKGWRQIFCRAMPKNRRRVDVIDQPSLRTEAFDLPHPPPPPMRWISSNSRSARKDAAWADCVPRAHADAVTGADLHIHAAIVRVALRETQNNKIRPRQGIAKVRVRTDGMVRSALGPHFCARASPCPRGDPVSVSTRARCPFVSPLRQVHGPNTTCVRRRDCPAPIMDEFSGVFL